MLIPYDKLSAELLEGNFIYISIPTRRGTSSTKYLVKSCIKFKDYISLKLLDPVANKYLHEVITPESVNEVLMDGTNRDESLTPYLIIHKIADDGRSKIEKLKILKMKCKTNYTEIETEDGHIYYIKFRRVYRRLDYIIKYHLIYE